VKLLQLLTWLYTDIFYIFVNIIVYGTNLILHSSPLNNLKLGGIYFIYFSLAWLTVRKIESRTYTNWFFKGWRRLIQEIAIL